MAVGALVFSPGDPPGQRANPATARRTIGRARSELAPACVPRSVVFSEPATLTLEIHLSETGKWPSRPAAAHDLLTSDGER